MSNYLPMFHMDVIIYLCRNRGAGLATLCSFVKDASLVMPAVRPVLIVSLLSGLFYSCGTFVRMKLTQQTAWSRKACQNSASELCVNVMECITYWITVRSTPINIFHKSFCQVASTVILITRLNVINKGIIALNVVNAEIENVLYWIFSEIWNLHFKWVNAMWCFYF